jgi:hypothetical protein
MTYESRPIDAARYLAGKAGQTLDDSQHGIVSEEPIASSHVDQGGRQRADKTSAPGTEVMFVHRRSPILQITSLWVVDRLAS